MSLVWSILVNIYDYLKSKIEACFTKLSNPRSKRFWDNFSEKMKDRIMKATSAVDKEIKEVLEKLSAMKSALWSSALSVKEKFFQLKNWVGSMLKWMDKRVETIKNLIDITIVVARIINKCKVIYDNEMHYIYEPNCLVKGFFDVLVMVIINPSRLSVFLSEACSLFWKTLKMTLEEMKYGALQKTRFVKAVFLEAVY